MRRQSLRRRSLKVALDFLEKPFRLPDLIDLIRQYFEGGVGEKCVQDCVT